MEIIEVTGKHEVRDFFHVPVLLYRNDPNWVCPLPKSIELKFDIKSNSYLHKGEAARWVLKDDNGRLCGRIAAFFNTDKAAKYKIPVGGIGFFECINNSEAAFLLFDTAGSWLKTKGMEAMDGPVNPGENDANWGLLVEGFTPPAFGMNYNHPYYKDLFEAYGFRPFFEQESKILDLGVPFPYRFWKIAEWVMKKPGYSFKHYSKKHSGQFAKDLVKIHNEAWIYHEHFTPLDVESVRKSFIDFHPILVEEFIWFVYFNGEPVAFFIMLPDINQVLRIFRGNMNWMNKLRFLLLKNSTMINRARVTIMGVIPRFQGAGIESAIFWHLRDPVLNKRPHYTELEISWVGDFNPRMKATIDAMGAKSGKKHITYRKLFYDDIPFERAAPIMPLPDSKEPQTD